MHTSSLKFIRNTVSVENATLHLYSYSEQDGSDEKAKRVDFLHTHSYYEIFACLGDGIKIVWESGEVSVGRGEIAIIPPSLSHTMTGDRGSKYIALGVNAERLEGLCTHDLYGELKRIFSSTSPILISGAETLVRRLAELTGALRCGCGLSVLLTAVDLIHRLASLPSRAVGERHTERHEAVSSEQRERMVVIEHLINDRFKSEITPDDFAKELHLSRRQTERLVKERYGSTLRELICKRRAEYAAKLLMLSDMSVEEVSRESGFGCKETLSRRFREIYGTTPSHYREQARAKARLGEDL